MALITDRVADLLRRAAGTIEGFDASGTAAQVQFTKDIAFGDLQTNLAMTCAKALKRNPREIAAELIARIPANDLIEKAETAGPGFINVFLSRPAIESYLAEIGGELSRLTEADTSGDVIIDYSSPNIAKRMHIGHLRSTIIGDSIKRIYACLGYHVVADNHLGDWGTQFGKLITAYRRWLDRESYRTDAVEELERLYVKFEQESEKDPELLEEARGELVKLQDGVEENVNLWKEFVARSIEEYDKVYRRLGISFDTYHGESYYHDLMPDVLESLESRGLAVESEGATVVFFDESTHLHPCIVRKKDGAYLYATSDLACIRKRLRDYDVRKLVYVTDDRQITHFNQVFTIADMAGWKVERVHVPFGVMKFATGNFSTRKGNVIYLNDLLDEAERRAFLVVTEKNPSLEESTRREIARMVGLGAVKYADLSQNRTSTIIFDWDKMLSFDGNTAPYLQYTYARILSVFRKAVIDPRSVEPKVVLSSDAERKIVHLLLQFPHAVIQAAEIYRPNMISDYIYDLAQAYNTFYNSLPILKEEDAQKRASRLFLCRKTADVIREGLDLLGIDAPEQM